MSLSSGSDISSFNCYIFLILAIRFVWNRPCYTALFQQSVNINHNILSILKAKMSENLLNRSSFHTVIKNLTFYCISMYSFLILGGDLGGYPPKLSRLYGIVTLIALLEKSNAFSPYSPTILGTPRPDFSLICS